MKADKLKSIMKSLRQRHYTCDDGWYSCPQSEDGCLNEAEGDECNCGADKHNARLDQAIAAIELLEREMRGSSE